MAVSGYPVVVSGYLVAFSDYLVAFSGYLVVLRGAGRELKVSKTPVRRLFLTLQSITKAQKRPRGESARS